MNRYAGLPLTVKEHPRAKRVLVKLIPNKGLEVVTPRGYPARLVSGVLDDKRAWIERTRDRLIAEGRDLSGELPPLPDEMDYKAIDRIIQLDYLDAPTPVKLRENAVRLQVRGPLSDRAVIFQALQEYTAKKAREVLLPLLNDMSRRTGLTYSALRVRRQKTRWGSCSARGTISLNAKLLFLPPELVEHLILHELCHTKHLNHSPQYWACVAKYQPQYKQFEKLLSHATSFVPRWFA